MDTPGAKLDDGLMHPIASERPGKLGSGPADLAVTLNIDQPNAPFFDINGVVRPVFRPYCDILILWTSHISRPACQCSYSFSGNAERVIYYMNQKTDTSNCSGAAKVIWTCYMYNDSSEQMNSPRTSCPRNKCMQPLAHFLFNFLTYLQDPVGPELCHRYHDSRRWKSPVPL
jgi:hypothetical protein